MASQGPALSRPFVVCLAAAAVGAFHLWPVKFFCVLSVPTSYWLLVMALSPPFRESMKNQEKCRRVLAEYTEKPCVMKVLSCSAVLGLHLPAQCERQNQTKAPHSHCLT